MASCTAPCALLKILAMMLLLSHFTESSRTCPLSCTCTYDYRGTYAQCKNQLMTKMPWFYSNTWKVVFENTAFSVMRPNAFIMSDKMRSLIITNTKLSRITAGALRGLNSLMFVTVHASPSFPVTIETGVLSHLSKLQQLSITRNRLQTVPSDTLCDLPENSKVYKLHLYDNKITHLHLDPCIILHLPKLSVLGLSGNPLISLDSEAFKPFANLPLKQLMMTRTQLYNITEDVFTHMPQLVLLTIGSDNLVSIPEHTFNNTNITDLTLSGKHLENIPQDTHLVTSLQLLHFEGGADSHVYFDSPFVKASQLREIYLNHIDIDLSVEYFDNLANSPIEKVDFKYCKISTIHQNAFMLFSHTIQSVSISNRNLDNQSQVLKNISNALSNSSSLRRFVMRLVGLRTIQNDTFVSFGQSNSISLLDLSYNVLNYVGFNSFLVFHNLEQLNLAGNELTDDGLMPGSLRGLARLKILLLQSNVFKNIPKSSKVVLSPYLNELNMNDNDIEHFSKYSFLGYTNLERLYLRGNNIESIGAKTWTNLTKLTAIDLRENKLLGAPKNFFEPLSNLKILHLDNNEFSIGNEDTFKYLTTINYLSIKNNRALCSSLPCGKMFNKLSQLTYLSLKLTLLSDLAPDIFRGLNKLILLDLSLNQISSIHPDVFVPLTNLTDLILTNNRLSTLMADTFRHLVSLRNINLLGNSFMCNCDIFWFSQWMIITDINVQQLTIKNRYVCKSPPQQHNKDLLHYMANADCQYTDLSTILTLYILTLIGCTFLSIIYRYRWHLRYYVYKIKANKVYLNEMNHEEYLYDAFVCYHYSCMDWIIEKMIPQLEYNHNIKLCIHHRDWLPGNAIVDNIMYSIQQSRATVFLVNKSFAQSHWGREEIDMAYANFVSERRNSILVILMEGIENGMINRSLRNLLTTQTYLPWIVGGKKERRFWKTLRESLKK